MKLTEKFENSEQAKVNTEQRHCFHVKNDAKLPAALAPSPLRAENVSKEKPLQKHLKILKLQCTSNSLAERLNVWSSPSWQEVSAFVHHLHNECSSAGTQCPEPSLSNSRQEGPSWGLTPARACKLQIQGFPKKNGGGKKGREEGTKPQVPSTTRDISTKLL